MIKICESLDMSVDEVKEVIDNDNKSYGYDWEDDVLTDGEIEYQLTSYSNRVFRSILVRLCNDTTHTFREFFERNYNDIFDLIDDAFSDDVIEELANKSERGI